MYKYAILKRFTIHATAKPVETEGGREACECYNTLFELEESTTSENDVAQFYSEQGKAGECCGKSAKVAAANNSDLKESTTSENDVAQFYSEPEKASECCGKSAKVAAANNNYSELTTEHDPIYYTISNDGKSQGREI